MQRRRGHKKRPADRRQAVRMHVLGFVTAQMIVGYKFRHALFVWIKNDDHTRKRSVVLCFSESEPSSQKFYLPP